MQLALTEELSFRLYSNSSAFEYLCMADGHHVGQLAVGGRRCHIEGFGCLPGAHRAHWSFMLERP